MLEYDRIDMLDGIDVNKTTVLSEMNFRFQPKLFDGCHDLTLKAMSFNDVAIVSVKGNYYRIQFWYMSKDEAINILRNPDLTEKNGTLQNTENFLQRIKDVSKEIRSVILKMKNINFTIVKI